jgi:hypothetical protein
VEVLGGGAWHRDKLDTELRAAELWQAMSRGRRREVRATRGYVGGRFNLAVGCRGGSSATSGGLEGHSNRDLSWGLWGIIGQGFLFEILSEIGLFEVDRRDRGEKEMASKWLFQSLGGTQVHDRLS